MDFEEKTLDKKYVYKGKILNLRRDEIVLPDGNKSVREIVEHGGGSAVLCVKRKSPVCGCRDCSLKTRTLRIDVNLCRTETGIIPAFVLH